VTTGPCGTCPWKPRSRGRVPVPGERYFAGTSWMVLGRGGSNTPLPSTSTKAGFVNKLYIHHYGIYSNRSRHKRSVFKHSAAIQMTPELASIAASLSCVRVRPATGVGQKVKND
jgi:hypothetical protein